MVDYYDLAKQKWTSCGQTIDRYRSCPILWIENRDLLYIAGNGESGFGVEYIDLRTTNKEWSSDSNHFAHWDPSFGKMNNIVR